MSDEPATLQAILDRLGQVQSGVGQVRTELGQVHTELSQAHTELGQVRTELGQVHTEQGQLRHELAALDARVTQNHTDVMGRLDAMAETRIVDFAAGERAEKIASDTQRQTSALVASLSEQVNGMWRAIRRLEAEVQELRGGTSA